MNHSIDRTHIFKIAATYIGTIIGAGFASGQEAFQFFSTFGYASVWAIILTTLLFFFFGYMILLLGQKLKVTSFAEITRFTNGKFFGTLIDTVIIIFLFGVYAAMIAGAGAVFREQFHLLPLIGTSMMAIMTAVTVLAGMKGVINSISYLIPILLATILFITIYSLINTPLNPEKIQFAANIQGPTSNWLFSAVSYASLNLTLAVAILAPLGAETKERKTLVLGAGLGAIGLGIGILLINLCILANIQLSAQVEIPMIAIAKHISPVIQLIFAFVFLIAVYSTAVSNLYGLITRSNFVGQRNQKWIVFIITILAFAVSQLGFSTMIEYFYPIVGYGGALLLLGILYTCLIKQEKH